MAAIPGGGAPPAAGAGAAPPPLIHNYQDYYAEAARDPSSRNYGALMDDFNVPLGRNSRYSPAGLLQLTTAAKPSDTPLARVCDVVPIPNSRPNGPWTAASIPSHHPPCTRDWTPTNTLG
jgi:hypothetical protein